MTPPRGRAPLVSAAEAARDYFPGGVNAAGRSFQTVGGEPIVFQTGRGARLVDTEGRAYVDFVQGWGSQLLGHRPPEAVRALGRQASRLWGAGAPHPSETRLAEVLRSALPSLERMRFVHSTTEAVMGAMRVARAATARPLVMKFDGCAHGQADGLLVQAGSGLTTLGLPSSAGVDPRQASGTISIPYNDLASVQAAFDAKRGKVAAILVEPVATTMGLVPPRPGFLSGLKRLCQQNGALLIFDETMTAFRLGWGGAQTIYGVTPDLTVLGRTLAAGLPLGIFGGQRDLMAQVTPEGPVSQGSTLGGGPLVMEVALAVLDRARRPGFYERYEALTTAWATGFKRLLSPGRQTLHCQGGLFTLSFHPGPIHDFATARSCDQDLYGRFFQGLLRRGISFPPSPFETAVVGPAHRRSHLDRALGAIEEVFTELRC